MTRDNKMAVAVVLWIVCGVAGMGFYNASLRAIYGSHLTPYKTKSYWAASAFFSIGGPLLLAVSMVTSGMGEAGWTLSWQPPPRYQNR